MPLSRNSWCSALVNLFLIALLFGLSIHVFTRQAFQQELGARTTTIAFLQKSAKEIISRAEGDVCSLQSDLIELNAAWDRVCKLSVSKQDRLEHAQRLVRVSPYLAS